jgi:hypothetical protein
MPASAVEGEKGILAAFLSSSSGAAVLPGTILRWPRSAGGAPILPRAQRAVLAPRRSSFSPRGDFLVTAGTGGV